MQPVNVNGTGLSELAGPGALKASVNDAELNRPYTDLAQPDRIC